MYRRALLNTLLLGVLGLVVATLIGLLGPWSRIADAASHFRLHVAAAAALLLLLAALLRHRLAALAALAIALVNGASALTYDHAPLAHPAGGRALTVMTLNVLYAVDNDRRIAARIEAEQPDVVVFQELTVARRGLLRRLQAIYPWQVHCGPSWYCDVAIVSRHRWETAHARPVGQPLTKLARAHFGPEWGRLTIASLHLRWPLISDQRAELLAAWDELGRHGGPVVVAGDLNATPWSGAVQGFMHEARLTPAGGLTPTWPRRTFIAGRECLVCVPQLQLDHIFVSRQVRVLSFRSGADVGSDHLPLIARLELPATIVQRP